MNRRLATWEADGITHWGAVVDAGLVALSPDLPQWPTLRSVVEAGAEGEALAEVENRSTTHDPDSVVFLPPIPDPGKIICVGVNFPDRNAEYRDGTDAPPNPSLFPRFPDSFTGHGRPLIRPPESRELDYEGEVAVVIGRAGRRIAESDALGHVAALTLCNEGTIRDWTRHAKFNVTQGKNWERSGSMGPWLTLFDDPGWIDGAEIATRVNGEERQRDRLSRMLFPIRRQIAYISTFTTLRPGDIVVTGTPTGAGARLDPPKFLEPGDVVEVEASGLGVLRNTVADE